MSRKWSRQEDRLPLLLRGSRQVGKTYTVEKFARETFGDCVTVNFEYQPEYKNCFQSFVPQEIVNRISILARRDVLPGKSLLFLDEIQECPRAITALRYFREKMPRLHVAAAGSLLEFVLRQEDFKMPVGRAQFAHLGPLSFGEFIDALGFAQLRKSLGSATLKEGVDSPARQKAGELLDLYGILGGMPAAVAAYLKDGRIQPCLEIQSGLLATYRHDFGKYASRVDPENLQSVFQAVPRLVGQRFKFAHADSDLKAREVKRALRLLTLAGVVCPVRATAANGVPLGAEVNEKKFKVQFIDIGLVQRACGLEAALQSQGIMRVNAGAAAEQFAGQELLALGPPWEERTLFFWARDRASSQAEVDFVLAQEGRVYPVEVKAGKTGTLKSLKIFIEEKQSPFGVRFSGQPLSFFDRVLSIPLYMIEQTPRLMTECLETLS